MKNSSGAGRDALDSSPLSDSAAEHDIGSSSSERDENGDDVLPNLLLDVREGFLAAFRSLFRQFGVTDQQFRVLSILNKTGDLEIGKLARRGRIVAPSMTGILDRMVEIGWVARKASKGQRWGVVALTASGQRLIRQLQPQADERVAALQAALGPNQLKVLKDLLTKARAVIREMGAPYQDVPPTAAASALRKRSSVMQRGAKRKTAKAGKRGGGSRG